MQRNIWHWENPENNRYYRVTLNKDLFGDLVLTKCWGSKVSGRRGRILNIVCNTYSQAEDAVKAIHKRRIAHGYKEVFSAFL